MPKTKFQGVVFTALAVFCMVYCITDLQPMLLCNGLRLSENPAALCLQYFLWGLLCAVFRTVFKKQLEKE